MLISSLVLVAGCGKKEDKSEQKQEKTKQEQTTDDKTNQPNQSNQQETDTQQQQNPVVTEEKIEMTQEEAQKVTSVDLSNMSQGDLDALVEMFNDPNSTAEEKEAARIQLEQIFKQADANQQ